MTYVDPAHAASGRRRHDAWTTGDTHDIGYRPRIVLVVENRASRLWFPSVRDTIVVEGGGKAAAALLANVPWLRAAERIVYWGDIDADGYAILDRFRAALAEPAPDGAPPKPVTSILMDVADLHRYAQHGVNHDKAGRPHQAVPGDPAVPHRSRGDRPRHHRNRRPHPVPPDRTGSDSSRPSSKPVAGRLHKISSVTRL
ncbi:Wadjet anti-phage system protein JetD domain-containing protein [Spirillospora sp. NPDC047418]